MNGGNGTSDNVNCVDCALIVATMTNLLGGNLLIGNLQATDCTDYSLPDTQERNKFSLNTIKAIGKTIEDTMSSLGESDDSDAYFSFHCVPWQPADPENPYFNDPKNIIFDACVRFVTNEEDGTTTSAAGLELGADDDASGYRFGLASQDNDGVSRCLR
ncbi:MAG: hypothetical protein P8P74_11045 [Crocinitomicaceae bacterium]|nr:hypothetical protein [Crocinitomicaceae bacterium]